jgi:hypothetical protein
MVSSARALGRVETCGVSHGARQQPGVPAEDSSEVAQVAEPDGVGDLRDAGPSRATNRCSRSCGPERRSPRPLRDHAETTTGHAPPTPKERSRDKVRQAAYLQGARRQGARRPGRAAHGPDPLGAHRPDQGRLGHPAAGRVRLPRAGGQRPWHLRVRGRAGPVRAGARRRAGGPQRRPQPGRPQRHRRRHRAGPVGDEGPGRRRQCAHRLGADRPDRRRVHHPRRPRTAWRPGSAAGTHPELFRAIRGGGGNFGVATPVPVPAARAAVGRGGGERPERRPPTRPGSPGSRRCCARATPACTSTSSATRARDGSGRPIRVDLGATGRGQGPL